jgi:predicted phosphate transport protein (TIGR00153 family)
MRAEARGIERKQPQEGKVHTMTTLFGKTKLLESQIDEYLNHTSEVGLLLLEAIRDYLGGRTEAFETRRQHVSELEKRADRLRHDVEHELYVETLIPESRGDVLGLLEQTDEVIGAAKVTLEQLSVESPIMPDDLVSDFLALADYGNRAVQELVMGLRAYFRTSSSVTDHVHKVAFWEKEADKVGERLKRAIFKSDADLACKMHRSDFVWHIDAVADQAENVSERLTISAIKRTI